MPNRRRYEPTVPLLYIVITVGVIFCAGGLGIKTLLLKLQLRQGAELLQKKKDALAALETGIESLRAEKHRLTSIPALTQAIKDGTIRLRKIEPRFVLNIPAERPVVAAHAALHGPEGGR